MHELLVRFSVHLGHHSPRRPASRRGRLVVLGVLMLVIGGVLWLNLRKPVGRFGAKVATENTSEDASLARPKVGSGGIAPRRVDPANPSSSVTPTSRPILCASPDGRDTELGPPLLRQNLDKVARCGGVLWWGPAALLNDTPFPSEQAWASGVVSLSEAEELRRINDEFRAEFMSRIEQTYSLFERTFGAAPDADTVKGVADWCLGRADLPPTGAQAELVIYFMNVADVYEQRVAAVVGYERAQRLRWRDGDWNWGMMQHLGAACH